jgi:hypothetical protein
MSGLSTPTVVGPLTTWSASILVEGATSGARLTVREGGPTGRVVAEEDANGGRDRLPLLPGVVLHEGEQLFAHQDAGATSSGWTDPHIAEMIGATPSDWSSAPPPWLVSKLHSCGRAVWVGGGLPGAIISITSGGQMLGSGPVQEGNARVRLTQPLPLGGPTIKAIQTAPPGAPPPSGPASAITSQTHPLPVAPGNRLPQVAVGPPVPAGCDASIVVGGVVDGAEVTAVHGDGRTESAVFDLDRLTYVLGQRLDSGGGKVTLTQSVGDRCEVLPSEEVTAEYGPTPIPSTPVPLPPCAGAPYLIVEELSGGADVMITTGAATYRGQVAPGGHAQRFDVSGAAAGETVSVTQSMCGVRSAAGTTTVGAPTPDRSPRVVGPLFHCARVVRVVDVTPGALVRIVARGASGERTISALNWSATSTIAVPVSPALVNDDDIHAVQVACGGTPRVSDEPVRVEPLPDPLPVEIAFAFATQRSVTVVALPGALVRVYLRRDGVQEIGRSLVDPDRFLVTVDRPLEEGAELFAVQEICALRTEDGPVYEVKPGVRVFHLGAQKVWPVTSEGPGHDVNWTQGTLTCRIGGDNELSGSFKNAAEGSTADIEFNMGFTHPSGLTFGITRGIFLAADNDEHPDNKLLKQKGYLSESGASKKLPNPAWRDPATWSLVLGSQGTSKWQVALQLLRDVEVDDAERPDDDEGGGGHPPPSA